MLTDLHVRDLGVIEDLALEFGPGMTALTGETGAGKTLVVEALQLLLGGRANPGMVRAGASEALVEARFVVTEGDGEREVVVARSVPAEGRSRAWVDGRMAPLGALGEVAAELVEIHGQHEHRALVTAAAQRDVLDAFAGTDLGLVRALRGHVRALEDSLAALGGDEQQRAREADVLRYQVDEIAAAHLEDPEEEQALRLEEERLADATAYRDAALGALELLDPTGDEAGALDVLGRAAGALSGREAFDEYRQRLAAAAVELSDVARSLRDEVEGWEDDPGRLAEVQERRRRLAELRRKYGEDLKAVMVYAREGGARLAALADAEGEAARLQAEHDRRRGELARAEAAVRATRARAAQAFGRRVGEHLDDAGHGGGPPRGAGGDRGHRRAGRGGARGQRRGTRAAARPRRVGRGAGPGHARHPARRTGRPPHHGLRRGRRGGRRRGRARVGRGAPRGGQGPPGPGRDPSGPGGVAGRRADQRGQARVARAHRHDRRHGPGEDRVRELSRMLSGHPDSDAARAHARELLGATDGG